MIARYTASALVCDDRRLASPARLDGRGTFEWQEDIVARTTEAATKLLAVLDKADTILGIELLAACEAAAAPSERFEGEMAR